jgi:hypothetical protein
MLSDLLGMRLIQAALDESEREVVALREENAELRADAYARGVAAGKKAAIDVLRSCCLFDRKHQAELERLAGAGDLDARGRAYEHEKRADYLQELIDACEDAGKGGGENG